LRGGEKSLHSLSSDVPEGEKPEGEKEMRGRHPGAGLLIVQDLMMSLRPSYKEG